MRRSIAAFVSATALFAIVARPQSTAPAAATGAAQVAQQVRAWRAANQARVMNELIALLAIPNVATDTENIPRDAEKLTAMLQARGFATQLLPTVPERGPVVYGLLATPGATRTILFYMHYDGQPVDPSTWHGTKPFEPTLRDGPFESGGKILAIPTDGKYQDDWRLYARSSGDDKSPIVAMLAAMDALKAQHVPVAVNVKVVLDGEEEAGSVQLEQTLMAHRDLLGGDLLINGDGPVHQSGRQLIVFGNRGIVGAQVTVYGPSHSLHSGHYGNWAPNPAMRLAQLLASMKDDAGRVRIAHFYEGVTPLDPVAQKALDEMPANDKELEEALAIAKPEGSGKKLVDLLTLPSLNVDGLRSEDVGSQSRTVIPERATAAIDMRLVKNITPQLQFQRLVDHIRAQGYFVTEEEPTMEERRTHEKVARVTMNGGGYPAAMVSMDLPVTRKLTEVVAESVGGDLVKMPILGGSSPMYIFENLGLPVVTLPIVNYDDNQHSPDENLQLKFFWRGMEVYGAVLAEMKW